MLARYLLYEKSTKEPETVRHLPMIEAA